MMQVDRNIPGQRRGQKRAQASVVGSNKHPRTILTGEELAFRQGLQNWLAHRHSPLAQMHFGAWLAPEEATGPPEQLDGSIFGQEELDQMLLDALVVLAAWPRGERGLLISILGAGANPNCPCVERRDAVDAGAWLDRASDSELAPLHWLSRTAIAEDQRCAMARVLIEGGASPDLPSPDGLMPLHYACHGSLASRPAPGFIGVLVDGGANVNARTAQGYSALQLSLPHAPEAAMHVLRCAGRGLAPSVRAECLALVRRFLLPSCTFTGAPASDAHLRATLTPRLEALEQLLLAVAQSAWEGQVVQPEMYGTFCGFLS